MAIHQLVDQIWHIYDADNNKTLDKEETRQFVQDKLLSQNTGLEYSDEAFEEFFKKLDEDGSGDIDKNEMKKYLQ